MCVGICVYLLRASDLAGSIWNPHIIVLPLVALLLSCAAVVADDLMALPVATAWASFLMQTHVSTVPTCLGMGALTAGLTVSRFNRDLLRRFRPFIVVSIALAAVLWLPPLIDELVNHPGNLSRLWHYFAAAGQPGPSWGESVAAWIEMSTASMRPDFHVPWGSPYVPHASAMAATVAFAELLLLVVATHWAHKNGDRFVTCLSGLVLLVSVVGLWSIGQIRNDISGDYQIFWISIIGAIGWAILVALALTVVVRPSPAVGALARIAIIISILVVVLIAVRSVIDARDYAIGQTTFDFRRKVLSRGVLELLEREHIRRPLFRMTQDTWTDAACVVLSVYKHTGQAAVDRDWLFMFGEGLSPDGQEDVELHIVGSREHRLLMSTPGVRQISAYQDVYVDLSMK
jgi:hypothetical protein